MLAELRPYEGEDAGEQRRPLLGRVRVRLTVRVRVRV